jgi:gamma-glutamyltranspeptidase/glutathione hydrolase
MRREHGVADSEFVSGFRSGVTPEVGFALQNRGTLFNLKKASSTPTRGQGPFTHHPAFITKDGKPWISFGVMGGRMQPQGCVQIVMNLIDFGMGLQEAGVPAPSTQRFVRSDGLDDDRRGKWRRSLGFRLKPSAIC